jgi:hypothetical protein
MFPLRVWDEKVIVAQRDSGSVADVVDLAQRTYEPMAKKSAGILLYRLKGDDRDIEILLVHPGGPFWAKRDEQA